jgi:hypothetical protein
MEPDIRSGLSHPPAADLGADGPWGIEIAAVLGIGQDPVQIHASIELALIDHHLREMRALVTGPARCAGVMLSEMVGRLSLGSFDRGGGLADHREQTLASDNLDGTMVLSAIRFAQTPALAFGVSCD